MEHVEVLRHMKETIKAIMPSEVAALDAAIASLSAPQPPAEAQAQGGGEAELRHMVAKLAAHVRPTCGELWAEAERLLNRAAPPSAPVGVEGEAKARLFCLAEEEISSGTLDDLIDEAIDSDIVEPGDTLRVEEWVRVREFEVGPDDDERLAAQQGGSDNDR